jgi:hypothetical protein
MIELNPLDVLGIRKIGFLPLHFSTIRARDIGLNTVFLDEIENWITDRLSGRYCIVNTPMIGHNDVLEDVTVLGFEEPKEITYFLLSCPFIRRNT